MSNPGNCAYDEACSLRFMLTLKADMQANGIAITHPHLTRITNFTNLYIGNTTATTLQGNSSGVFDGYWRDADDVPELAIAGSTIELPSSDESLSVEVKDISVATATLSHTRPI